MIPVLYKPDETDFTTNGLGSLSDCISCTVTEERNAVYEMDIEYPIDGAHFSDIVNGSYIKAIPFYNGTPQIFFVYEISKPISGRVKIYCAHISYRLSLIPLAPFSATSAKDCFAKLKVNALEDCPFTFWTDREIEKAYYLRYPDSLRGKLQGDQLSILQNYKPAEFEWDNFTVRLWTERGANKGVMLRYGKNITDLKQEESIRNTVTGICPYWYGLVGEEEELVMLPEKIIYTKYVDNFPYKRTGVVDFTDQFEEKPTVAQLRSRAERYINENDIGIPRVSIKLSFVDLAQTEEYKDILPLQEVNLCDTINIVFERLGVNTTAKVTKTVWNVLLDRYDSIEIGSHSSNLADTIVSQGESIQTEAEKTVVNMTAALRQAQALINGGLGGYIVTNVSENGTPEEILIMDTPSISTAKNVIRLNKNGIGFSQNGYQGPFNSAWTIDGNFSANNISANSIDVSKMAGVIQNGNWKIDFTNGSMTLGNLSANNLTAGTINANVISIINLIAEKLQAVNSGNTARATIEYGTAIWDDKDTSSNWQRRIAIQSLSDGGSIMLYNKNYKTDGTATNGIMTSIGSANLTVGQNTYDSTQSPQGNIYAGAADLSSYVTAPTVNATTIVPTNARVGGTSRKLAWIAVTGTDGKTHYVLGA